MWAENHKSGPSAVTPSILQAHHFRPPPALPDLHRAEEAKHTSQACPDNVGEASDWRHWWLGDRLPSAIRHKSADSGRHRRRWWRCRWRRGRRRERRGGGRWSWSKRPTIWPRWKTCQAQPRRKLEGCPEVEAYGSGQKHTRRAGEAANRIERKG